MGWGVYATFHKARCVLREKKKKQSERQVKASSLLGLPRLARQSMISSTKACVQDCFPTHGLHCLPPFLDKWRVSFPHIKLQCQSAPQWEGEGPFVESVCLFKTGSFTKSLGLFSRAVGGSRGGIGNKGSFVSGTNVLTLAGPDQTQLCNAQYNGNHTCSLSP